MALYPYIKTDNEKINTAYHIAVSDLYGNIKPYRGGLLERETPVIIAGMGYCTPWTRDAAINTVNAGALLFPDAAKSTLLSVLKKENGKVLIDGEYWDSIIWVWGAWHEYLLTGDKDFLKTAYEASINTLEFFENTEFDEQLNLFRGPACYGDGVAAYPDIYAKPGESGIKAFAEECRELCADKGVGIPMFALSTNCLYYKAHITADKMASELGLPAIYTEKAEKMKMAINTYFWSAENEKYRYLIDDFGGCDCDEGMGNSFVLLFGIADKKKAEKVLKNQHITTYGIPCVYPSFSRYKDGYGRHSGPVWPHIQAFWADAAAQRGKYDLFDKEFNMLTDCSVRDGYFSEIYHPDTGERYGGLQEDKKQGIRLWESEKKQTWSATGYLHMLFCNIAGMNFEKGGIRFEPYVPNGISNIEIGGLCVRGCNIDISIFGNGKRIKSFTLNGKNTNNFIKFDGDKEITIIME